MAAKFFLFLVVAVAAVMAADVEDARVKKAVYAYSGYPYGFAAPAAYAAPTAYAAPATYAAPAAYASPYGAYPYAGAAYVAGAYPFRAVY